MPTIDILTTPKPFLGPAALHQSNALRSWRASRIVGKILVFGAVSGETGSIAETGSEVVLDVECTDNGLPSIRSMFEIGAKRSGADLLMFTNADMIYLPSFFSGVAACATVAGGRFLLVGSRMDFDSDRGFSFASPADIAVFEEFVKASGKMHPPAGSDYFVFPRRQYLENRLPDLWIGRGGWDLYMICHARTHGIVTVDASPSLLGFHQNHDYSNRGKDEGVPYEKDPEAAYNLSLLPEDVPWNEWTLTGCEKEWVDGILREKARLRPAGRERMRTKPRQSLNGRVRQAARPLWKRVLRRLTRLLRKPAPKRREKAPTQRHSAPDSRIEAQRRLQQVAAGGGPLRIVVGAAHTLYDGWISTNIDSLNLLDLSDWQTVVGDLKLDRVLAEHVWEHLSPDDGIKALKNVAMHLKSGGRVRIAVPDGHHPDASYIEHVRPGGIGPGADDHKILYTLETLEASVRKAGLEPEVMEYWDTEGRFHAREWDPVDGQVLRSKEHDPRNADGVLHYTSLIVDGVKP